MAFNSHRGSDYAIPNTPSVLIKPALTNKKKFSFSQRIGEQAVYDYYKNYKSLKKSVEREEHTIYPQSSYIYQCEQQNLIPRPYGIVNWKGKEDEINVENFMMGDQYAQAYGQGLQLMNAKKVNLSNNRLLEKGSYSILQGLNKKVQELDLSNNKVGLNSIDYIGKMFQSGDSFSLRVIKIEHSGITDQQLITLIEALHKTEKTQLIELNLARNLITDHGGEKIAEYLTHANCELRVLNLHWNKLKVKGGLKLAEAVTKNQVLKILDLSWNCLGVVNVQFVGCLPVNEIKKKLKGIQSANQEQALDQLTELERQLMEEELGKKWGVALKQNRTLIHLDLSYNGFGLDSIKQISHRIQKNHTLYGLHMAGNNCLVDSHGFLLLNEEEKGSIPVSDLTELQKKQEAYKSKQQGSSQGSRQVRKRSQASAFVKSPQKEVLFKRMEGVKAVIKKRNQSLGQSPLRASQQSNYQIQPQQPNSGTINNRRLQSKGSYTQSISDLTNMPTGINACQQLLKFKIKDNCWLCEGWSEFKFDLRLPQIGAEVYLHFDFDDYKPDLMISTSAGIYQVFRMIPPGLHYFFFSINGEYMISNNQAITIIDHEHVSQIHNKLIKTHPKQKQPFNMQKVNFVESQFHEQNVNPEKYEVLIKNCLPRPDKKYTALAEDRPRTPWTFPISLFKDYKPDTPTLVNECFEFDWQCLKKPKLKKSGEDEFKEKCRQIYPFIRAAYKRLAAIGIVGTVFSIGWNVFREFVTSTINISDKDKLKPDDCDRLFIGVNANQQKKSPFIPEKALVRFQLLEIIVKAALKKYFESGDVQDECEAVDQLNINFLIPYQDNILMIDPYMYDQQKWRNERYWNEACDNIFKAFGSFFTYLYNTYGGTHKKPGQKTFMTLDEFDLLIQQAGLLNDLLNARDTPVCFNFAMMLQINEIDQERHLQATYLEFIEAYARACELASINQYYQQGPTSPKANTNEIDGNQEFLMNEEERKSLPLHVKIENTIPYLLKNCCVKAFLDKFEMPKKHPQVGLYILPNKKFF